MSEPAFPYNAPVPFDSRFAVTGLTKREWFAGMALAGFAASPHANKAEWEDASVAKCAFEIADAMLAASKEPRP